MRFIYANADVFPAISCRYDTAFICGGRGGTGGFLAIYAFLARNYTDLEDFKEDVGKMTQEDPAWPFKARKNYISWLISSLVESLARVRDIKHDLRGKALQRVDEWNAEVTKCTLLLSFQHSYLSQAVAQSYYPDSALPCPNLSSRCSLVPRLWPKRTMS